MRARVRLHNPVARKQKTISSRPAVSSHETSPYIGFLAIIFAAVRSRRARQRTGYAMPFATINGIRINYLVQGAGPHLLMFAPGGWRSVISRWTAAGGKEAFGQMDGLAALSKHFTCIAYDRRECGLS